MSFKLKEYKLLPTKCVTLWLDIQEIIGPVKNWPPRIRNLFFKEKASDYERLKLCAFCYINGLNPELFFEWAHYLKILKDDTAKRECTTWLHEFETNNIKWKRIYQYNVYYHRYEFIDGSIKFHMPLNVLHP